LQLCRQAALTDPASAVAALALASACREQQDLAGARQELGRAIALGPDWEAAHYEDAKFWLAVEEMERARDPWENLATPRRRWPLSGTQSRPIPTTTCSSTTSELLRENLGDSKNRKPPSDAWYRGSRNSYVRLANDDIQGAERDLWHFADQAPPEEREDLLLEAYDITEALIRHAPDSAEIRAFLARIARELG
jgi:hypothetical protein